MISPSTSTINRMCPEPECWGPTLNVSVCAPESEVSVDSTVVRGTGFGGADIAGSVRRESYVLPEGRRPVPVIRKKQLLQSRVRSEEHTSELQSPCNLVCRLLLEKKKKDNALCHDICTRA